MSGMKKVIGLAGFLIFLALAFSLSTMNITILGLDFSAMDYGTFQLYWWALIILAFGSLFGGLME